MHNSQPSNQTQLTADNQRSSTPKGTGAINRVEQDRMSGVEVEGPTISTGSKERASSHTVTATTIHNEPRRVRRQWTYIEKTFDKHFYCWHLTLLLLNLNTSHILVDTLLSLFSQPSISHHQYNTLHHPHWKVSFDYKLFTYTYTYIHTGLLHHISKKKSVSISYLLPRSFFRLN